ncbi:hypothetical protein E5N72_18270 [Pseudoalteromonas sp. MEBiC 03607]|nr:hypothetical protein E5N72_18270 [Pseudoalteromonas sp. MEBiC 03607]
MNEFLQLIGSLASIVGVPLAIYLYLKGQVQKYTEVRREIVKRLSHQIGEGRNIGLFELNAIIDSLVREKRLKSGSISSNSVIEDLIAETVSSPLLESTKKESLINELSEVHTLGQIFNTIRKDRSVFSEFIEHVKPNDNSEKVTEQIQKDIESIQEKSAETSKAPEIFGAIASLAAVIAASLTVAGFTESLDIIPKFLDSSIVTSLGLGMLVSMVAGFATAVIGNRGKKSV